MAFPISYREIRRLVRQKALSVPTARAIVRRSGFTPGALTASGVTILTMHAVYEAVDGIQPYGLPHYVTKCDFAGPSGVMIAASVASGTGTLRAVWAETKADLVAGNGETLQSLSFSGSGFYRSGWTGFPGVGDVFVAFWLDAAEQEEFSVRSAELRIRSGGSPPPNSFDGPGRLTEEGGEYFADYAVETGNFGYADAVAEAHFDAVLQDSLGWERTGVTFRNVGSGAPVTYRFVDGPMSCGGVMANGCTTPVGDGAEVWINYNRAVLGYERNLINHETGHAFFGMGHTGGGIMNGLSPDGWPTNSDIQSVIAWLRTR